MNPPAVRSQKEEGRRRGEVSEKPILFQPWKVRAILNGTGTVTRRIVRPQPEFDTAKWIEAHDSLPDEWIPIYEDDDGGSRFAVRCPYGSPGTRLWVRETWARLPSGEVFFRASDKGPPGLRWRPSIFMPRLLSRLTLEVVSVRVERLQEITEEDVLAEGLKACFCPNVNHREAGRVAHGCTDDFAQLWDSINRKRAPWAANPWVWRIEFKRAAAKVQS